MYPAHSEFRHHWALRPDIVFLNHGSFGACPKSVLEEQHHLRTLVEQDPMDFYFAQGPQLWNRALEALSEFLGADPVGMTFQVNATAGVNTVLNSLKLKPGDEILVHDHAYQACRNAVDAVASRKGAKVVVAGLPFPLEHEDEFIAVMRAGVTTQTKLAMIDTVTSPTALRLPFERVTRELQGMGVDVLVDAAHGPGLIPLNLADLEAAYVTGNCHKWLCTPKGSGFLHVRADRRSSVEPLVVSHGYSESLPQPEKFRAEFDWQGTQDFTPWLCIPKAIKFIGGLLPGGWPEVMARNQALAVRARDTVADALGTVTRVPSDMLAAMASLELPAAWAATSAKGILSRDPLAMGLYDKYRIQAMVFAWPAHGRRYLRISAGLYNTDDEYRYLVDSMQSLVA